MGELRGGHSILASYVNVVCEPTHLQRSGRLAKKRQNSPKAILPLVAESPRSVIAHTLDAIAKATQKKVSIKSLGMPI